MLINNIKEKYSIETALLVLCCRHFIQTADNETLDAFLKVNKIEWNKIYQLSMAHRIRPVVYKVLFIFKEIIGQDNLEELRTYCIYFNAFALSNKRELYRISEILKEQNIEAKPYKGIAFAEKFYADIGSREFSDNDLIIKEQDIDKVVHLMRKEGYHLSYLAYYTKFPHQYIKYNKDVVFEKYNENGRAFAFEFHFKNSGYIHGYPFSFIEVLGKGHITESRKYNGTDHLKLMTINHGVMDLYPDLRSILDITVILKKTGDITLTDIDPIINRYLKYVEIISFEILNNPAYKTEIHTDKKAVIFSEQLIEKILSLVVGKRIPFLKYIILNMKQSNTAKGKISYLKNYVLFKLRPNALDINMIKLPYYSLYFFTKPLRILKKLFLKNSH